MLIVIFLVITVIMALVSMFGGFIKKTLEVIAFVAKFLICGGIMILLFQLLNIEFSSDWAQLGFAALGGIILFALVVVLAGVFRLVGFSINFLINSFVVLLLTEIIQDEYKIQVTFITYAIVLFFFPRLMWISDRFSTTTEYSHTESSAWSDIKTNVYIIKDVDWWEGSESSWGLLPLQIIIASFFYAIGSITLLGNCPIESTWLLLLYIVLATAINVLFDLFAFRYIDEAIG